MEPVSDADQSCHSFHLAVSPATELFRYPGRLRQSRPPLQPAGAARAGAHPGRQHRRDASPAARPGRQPGHLSRSTSTRSTWTCWTSCSSAARSAARRCWQPLLDALRPEPGHAPGRPGRARSLGYICSHFEYARDVTLASSPIDDVLEHGKGVCQDFTHLMIAVLRSFGVPARYVSGYIHRPNKESQSHAWCEAWLPDLGWVGIDPTNDRLVGRAFRQGGGRPRLHRRAAEQGHLSRPGAGVDLRARRDARRWNGLPSLSWQEQLPPLNVPLTAILPRPHGNPVPGDEDQQQQ